MNLAEKTSEKLQGELKVMKVITRALIGVLGALFLFCVYGLLTNEDNTFFISILLIVCMRTSSLIIEHRI